MLRNSKAVRIFIEQSSLKTTSEGCVLLKVRMITMINQYIGFFRNIFEPPSIYNKKKEELKENLAIKGSVVSMLDL